MNPDVKTRAGIKRQIKLPNREAVKIALRSVRIRIWRSIITIAGIILAIAFLSSVLTTGAIAKAAPQAAAAQSVDAKPGSGSAVQLWMTGISLLVCVVGITNAMLMSVTERYREIGTMKCLGALDWFVVKLFLFEAGFMGIIGSVAGAILGLLFALSASMTQYDNLLGFLPWRAVMARMVLAIVVGAGLTIVGAIYPARRAGKMPPADAMRSEV